MRSQSLPKTTTFTIRVPVALRQRLEKLAKSTYRSRSWLAADAVASYVEQQQWQMTEIEAGVKDSELGRVVAHDQVKSWLNSWGTETEQDPPTCT